MQLQKNDIQNLLLGSTFLGTGGGGNPKEADQIYQKLLNSNKMPKILDIQSFKPDDIFITAFGIGSVKTSSDPKEAVRLAYNNLSKLLNKKIKGIIPVEIGAKSVATAFLLASQLDLPIIDADFVGGRSTPEVYLETITLFDILRTPAAIANNQGDVAILSQSVSPIQEEKFFREFTNMSGERAYVVGYPITKKLALKSLTLGTIKKSIDIGKLISQSDTKQLSSAYGVKNIFEGRVVKIKEEITPGFTTQMVTIENSQAAAIIYIRNENLICWINNKVKITCPDLIILLDKNDRPIFNADLRKNQFVKIVACPASPLWRTKKGLALFNPKTFGFSFNPKLLKE